MPIQAIERLDRMFRSPGELVTYRKKQLIALAAFTLVANTASTAGLFFMARTHYYNEYRAKLLSIAVTSATLTDGDQLQTIQSRGDEASPGYAVLLPRLREVRDANRRKDTQVQRLFTVVPSQDNPSILEVAADPEESPALKGHAGEVYRTQAAIDIAAATVEEQFSTDQFGHFLRAHAPVRDRNGKVVGAVIAQASVDWVEGKLRPLAEAGLISLGASLLLAIPVACWLSSRASRPLLDLKRAVDGIATGDFSARANINSTDEFGDVAKSVNAMAAGLSERERVKTAFARYVSQQVLDSVLKSEAGDALKGDRRRISVLFSDIRGFSKISEKLSPEKVVQLLNEYFELMVEVVFRNHGTLDKFMGDGLMAIFGAPENDPYQEEHALKAAVEMQHELEKLQQKWSIEGIHIRIGIGIHSGPAIVGTIGSSRRMEYTAIGDTVNVASRLEAATKEMGTNILVSEHTYYGAKDAFPFRNMGAIIVRGREEPLTVYSLEPKSDINLLGSGVASAAKAATKGRPQSMEINDLTTTSANSVFGESVDQVGVATGIRMQHDSPLP
jgi:adenylate cyclase